MLSLLALLLPRLTPQDRRPSVGVRRLSCLPSQSPLGALFTQLTRIPSSSSVFSRLFRSKKPTKNLRQSVLPPPNDLPNVSLESKLPPAPPGAPLVRPRTHSTSSSKRLSPISVTAANAAPSPSPRSPTSLSPLASPTNPRFSFRPGIGQPPVFRRPTATLGTAASGIILPRRKDGRDLWVSEDNGQDEEPDAQERLKSQILVTGWLDAGAEAEEANRKSEEQERDQGQELDAAPASSRKSGEQERDQGQELDAAPASSPPAKLVLHIDTNTHKSPSMPALVVNLVDSDDDEREDRVPELDPSASSTAGSPSIITHHTGESVWSPVIRTLSERDTSPSRSGMLLPTIAEPDTTIAEEDGDQFSGDSPRLNLSPPPEKKPRRRSVLGISSFGSRRFSVRPPSRANTLSDGIVPSSPTTPTTKPGRRRTMLGPLLRRQSVLSPPSEAELVLAEEKMVQPTIHTMGTLNAHIMNLEDEEERRLAELAYFG